MKNLQLQIRVSAEQKKEIKKKAQAAHLSVSEWVLSQILPPKRDELVQILLEISNDNRAYALVELDRFLSQLSVKDFVLLTKEEHQLPPLAANLYAAAIEYYCHRFDQQVPKWVRDISPLEEPFFASSLLSLRLYLLRSTPAYFKKRNIFADTGFGEGV